MKNLKLDDILNIVNNEKEKRGFINYAPCYPMLRVMNEQLYIAVMISDCKKDIWNESSKADYWCLIDPKSYQIIEYNKTSEKDYMRKYTSIPNINKENELSILEKSKVIEYENFLLEDIQKTEITIQKELSSALNGKIVIDNKAVNINDYIMDNLQKLIKIKSKELVDLLLQSKYSLITVCYDNLWNEIIKEYTQNGIINKEKIKLCIKVMQCYYSNMIGIQEFFNI